MNTKTEAAVQEKLMNNKHGFGSMDTTGVAEATIRDAVISNAAGKAAQVKQSAKNGKHTNTAKPTTNTGDAYLTKRILVKKAQAAGRATAKNAMQIMGFVVTAQDGWIVKKYVDGRIEKLSVIQ